NDASFAFDGLLKPLIFLTNWSDAARTSSSVTGGSKLKSVLIFLHMTMTSTYQFIAGLRIVEFGVLNDRRPLAGRFSVTAASNRAAIASKTSVGPFQRNWSTSSKRTM